MSAPAGWVRKPLRDVVTLQRGFDLPHAERAPGPYPILSAGASVGTHSEPRVQGPGFAIGRATNLGQPTWSATDYWPLNTTLFAKDFHGNSPHFLFHLFESLDLTGFDSGSVQPMLNRNYISDLEVLVPPLPEQQAIAEVLGALDDKIAANAKLMSHAERLAQAVTQRALQDCESVPLSSLATVTMGSSPAGTSYNETGDGTVMYQGMRDFGARFPSPRVWTTEPVRLARKGDILFSVRAPVGQLNFADSDCCIGRGLAALSTPRAAALFHLLKAQPELFASFNHEGTIFGSINKPQLNALPIAIPRDGISSLDAQLDPIEYAVTSAVLESLILADLRDTLLPALMDGRIRVKDAVQKVEEVL